MVTMKTSALLIVTETLSEKDRKCLSNLAQSTVVVSPVGLREYVQTYGHEWVSLESLIQIESIYDANILLEELSLLTLPNGTRLAKSCVYKGYELWWTHYTDLFLNFCIPYTRYKPLLEYLKNFEQVYYFKPIWSDLFRYYLHAHGSRMRVIQTPRFSAPSWLPLGVLVQVLLTLISLPVLVLMRRNVLVFTGDKFDGLQDFDFRMKFVYEGLRERKMPFIEFVRSLQPWKVVLQHAVRRRRPVVYAVAVAWIARSISSVTFGRYRSEKQYALKSFESITDTVQRFKYMAASQYLRTVSDDIWAIRIMRLILGSIGIKAAFIPAANERNFHTVLGCKLVGIPTVGILHGVAMAEMCVYDFIPQYDGEKSLSVDVYGVWSEWWKQYYLKKGNAYTQNQLHVSGPMRPLSIIESEPTAIAHHSVGEEIRVLFISEEVAVPQEVLPYLNALIASKHVSVTIKFRPYRDEFEKWLLKHNPSILKEPNVAISREKVQDAIVRADVVTGCYSTAVLEAFIQLKPPVFFRTRKWGDYYGLKDYDTQHSFFAESPEELIDKILAARASSRDTLAILREQYFGDPYKNGSAWVVDQLALWTGK